MALIVLAGLLLIVPLWYVWEWWTEGTLAGIEALALSALLLLVFGQMVAFESWRPALFILVIAAMFSPFLSSVIERRSGRKLNAKRLDTYRQAIDYDPSNIAARVKLAQTLYNLGRLDEAIMELQSASEISRTGFPEQDLLSNWQEERRLRNTRNVTCDSCGKENERGVRVCGTCGRRLPQGRSAGWMHSGGPKSAVISWIAAVTTVAFILLMCVLFPRLRPPSPPFLVAWGFGAWTFFYLLLRRR